MQKALNVAKYFLKRGLDTNPNTYDGNMKLQKLLFFADFISLAETGKRLFPEPIRAFSNGCVVEEVRLRYKNDYAGLQAESESFIPDFSQDEYNILGLTEGLFGRISARELSELNHSFDFWKECYHKSKYSNGFKDKDLAVIPEEKIKAETGRIREVVAKYKENQSEESYSEMINGIRFFYSPGFDMSEEIIAQLDEFSMRNVEDDTYSVYLEDGELVII